MTMTFSVLCEYLANENERIRRAAFSAIRLIIEHGLHKKFFAVAVIKENAKAKTKRDENILELLKFSELSLNEEVKSIRKGNISG